MCGCMTSDCVCATRVDKLQNGLRPMVVPAAIGDRAAGQHEHNLFDLAMKYEDPVTVEETVA